MFPLTEKMNDMFPLTYDIHSGVSGHVECVALMSKLDSKKHISVEFQIDEMDIMQARAGEQYLSPYSFF